MIVASLFSILIAVTSFSFDVTATGVEKGTPLEFLFAGRNTDRDYETMFILDESIESFCRRLEDAGIPRGRPTDVQSCRFWPVGCAVTLKPSLQMFVKTDLPDGLELGPIIYTGGVRDAKGNPVAETNMPSAAFCLYTLSQSPLLFNGSYEQSVVYGHHTAAQTLKKGEKVRFTLECANARLPNRMSVRFRSGRVQEVFREIRAVAEKGETDLRVEFDDDMSVEESIVVAQALSVLDSQKLKVNGCPDDGFFYRAFLPLVKWKDRKERLVQPFEVVFSDSGEKLTVIDEDWSGEGTDPKLTPREISFEQSKKTDYAKIDTCFIFARKNEKLARLREIRKRLPQTVLNYYVFGQ